MESISTTAWRRKSFAVIFDRKSLGAVISLRQALAWFKGLPAAPPVPGRTILIKFTP